MAQVNIVIDTDNQTMSVQINGTEIPNVTDSNIYAYRDANGNMTGLDVSIHTQEVGRDVSKRVSYYTTGSEKAQKAMASAEKVYDNVDGFVGVDDTNQTAQDIEAFISSKKRGF